MKIHASVDGKILQKAHPPLYTNHLDEKKSFHLFLFLSLSPSQFSLSLLFLLFFIQRDKNISLLFTLAFYNIFTPGMYYILLFLGNNNINII